MTVGSPGNDLPHRSPETGCSTAVTKHTTTHLRVHREGWITCWHLGTSFWHRNAWCTTPGHRLTLDRRHIRTLRTPSGVLRSRPGRHSPNTHAQNIDRPQLRQARRSRHARPRQLQTAVSKLRDRHLSLQATVLALGSALALLSRLVLNSV